MNQWRVEMKVVVDVQAESANEASSIAYRAIQVAEPAKLNMLEVGDLFGRPCACEDELRAKMEMALEYAASHPKSACRCGHTGDGTNSEHAGITGHGYCQVPGCACDQFSWGGFTPAFQQFIAGTADGEDDAEGPR